MAADEAMLEAAVRGLASLRFYGWTEPTVTLGYFQPESVRREDALLATLPYVRRATGGMALIHHHELTYAVALPAESAWQARTTKPQAWLCRVHTLLQSALAECGVSVAAAQCGQSPRPQSVLCFQHVTPGDLLIDVHKVVGSAQRKQRGALLQHGAILLAVSTHAPSLPGIVDLSGRGICEHALSEAISAAWRRVVGGELAAQGWSGEECTRIETLAREKYSQAAWNARR